MSAAFQLWRTWVGLRNTWILWRKPRHRRNVRQARKILRTLRGITSDKAVLNYVQKISPYVFEELVLELFCEAGWLVWRSPSYSGDGGWDGQVRHPLYGKCLVQSKRYTHAISVQHVRDFVHVVGRKRWGFFVHCSTHSSSVAAMTRGSRVRMVSGLFLVNAIRDPKKYLGLVRSAPSA